MLILCCRLIIEAETIAVQTEVYGGWSTTATFYAPNAEYRLTRRSPVGPRPQLESDEKRCLHRAVWPLEAARKLSAWYPDECGLLCGLDSDKKLFIVEKGNTVEELTRADAIPF